MSRTKWGVTYNGDDLTLPDMLHFASRAQDAGADILWTAEGWRDAFVPLTAIAGVAKNTRVGTAIAQMARPPVPGTGADGRASAAARQRRRFRYVGLSRKARGIP